jgi:Caspase domain
MAYLIRPFFIRWALSGVAMLLAPGLLSAQADTPKRYALLVGVNNYQHEKLKKLDFAVNDAHDLADLLKQAGYHITLLSDRAGRDDKERPHARQYRTRAQVGPGSLRQEGHGSHRAGWSRQAVRG